MIALFCLFLALFASSFKSKSRLEGENAALRHQLIILRRKVRGRVRLTGCNRAPDAGLGWTHRIKKHSSRRLTESKEGHRIKKHRLASWLPVREQARLVAACARTGSPRGCLCVGRRPLGVCGFDREQQQSGRCKGWSRVHPQRWLPVRRRSPAGSTLGGGHRRAERSRFCQAS
jgi:hypothetical protein